MPTPKALRGARSELVAAASLMEQGYYVFRSESQHAPFDLVAYRDGICLRVEVKTAHVGPDGSVMYAKPRNNEWDLLVVVYESQTFMYHAPLVHEQVSAQLRLAVYGAEASIAEAWTRLPCGATVKYVNRHKAACAACSGP